MIYPTKSYLPVDKIHFGENEDTFNLADAVELPDMSHYRRRPASERPMCGELIFFKKKYVEHVIIGKYMEDHDGELAWHEYPETPLTNYDKDILWWAYAWIPGEEIK